MSGTRSYRRMAVTTADPMQILVALYDGLLRHMHSAKIALEEGDAQRVGNALSKALAIISELDASVDESQDPQFSQQLCAIYAWASHELIQSNVHRDPARVEQVIPLFKELRDAWADAATKVRAETTKRAV